MNLNWVMVILLVIGCALLVTPTTATTGWLESHDNRISLEIDHSDLGAGLDQFPVALFITDSSGIGGTDLTLIFDEVGDDYTKVAVTSGNGVTVLYTEVECWDAVNEQAVLWVSPDLSASENTTLYLYFDATAPNNPRIGWTGTAAAEEVWDANFVGVWHMADSPLDADVVLDSTSNGNDGTKNGGMGVAAWGDVGMAQTFDGTNDYISYGSEISLSTTFSVFAGLRYVDSPHYCTYGFITGHSSDTTKIGVHMVNDLAFARVLNGGATDITKPLIPDAFLDFSIKRNAADLVYFSLNGAAGGILFSGAAQSGNHKINRIGADGSGDKLEGAISEVRISNIARSDEWIAATHLSNTDALVTWDGTVGSVETVDAVPLPVWIAVLIGAVGCVLHCWADCDNEKHLQIVTGAFGMLMLLWLGVTLSGGTIAYYLDDGLHTIQDSILPWFFGMFAVVIGIMVSGYVAELFVVEIESEEGVDS